MKLCNGIPQTKEYSIRRFLSILVSMVILLSTICGSLHSFVMAEEPEEKMAVLVSEQEGSNFCVIPALTPGEKYAFELYYVSESHIYDPIKILYETDKSHTMARISDISITNELEWYKYKCEFTVPEDGYITGSGSKKVTNVLLSVSMGTVGNKSWVYGLSLTKDGVPDNNLLKYPDFSRNFSSYYIYDENHKYDTRIAGSKSKDTLGGCSLEAVDMSVFEVPDTEQKPGKMAELTCPFPSASFCTVADLTPGKTYVFSIYYNTESSVAEPIKIFYQGSSAQWGLYQKLNINGDDVSDIYRYYVYEFKVPTNGTVIDNKTSILFSVSMGAIGKKSWIYDLKLIEKDDADQKNILSNPLFENNFSGYRIYNSTYTNFIEGPVDSNVFSYDYYGTVSDSTIQAVNMSKFEKPAPFDKDRMVKIDCPSAGGWFLMSAKTEMNKAYEATFNCRSRYILKDLVGVFYEDASRKLKRISDALVTEDEEKHKYTVQFKTPETDCYVQGDKINIFFGVNLSFSGTVPNSSAQNQIFIYEPVLKEKDTPESENLFKDPYFKRNFTYCTSLSKNLSSRVAGPIDTGLWDTFELVDIDVTVFDKHQTNKMAKLVCPYWSAYFISRARVVPGETYVFALDYYTDADLEDPIRLMYGGGAAVGYTIQQIVEYAVTEDPDKDRYFYEFKVPEDGQVSNGTIELYCNVVMGEVNNIVYVDNLSLTNVNDETAKNLIVNPQFDSNYYGYYIYNHEYNSAMAGASDTVDFGKSAIVDRDEAIFTKSESAKIIGTDWAMEFGEIRKKNFLNKDEPEEEIPDIPDEDIPVDNDFIVESPAEDTQQEIVDTNTNQTEQKKPEKVKRVKKVRVVEEYYDYTWIVVASISAGVVFIAGVITFIIIRKKKKKG